MTPGQHPVLEYCWLFAAELVCIRQIRISSPIKGIAIRSRCDTVPYLVRCCVCPVPVPIWIQRKPEAAAGPSKSPCLSRKMPHSFGKRARTRQKFSKGFRQHGMPSVSRYLQTFKKGDYVDIVVDGAVQKGMPFQYYHGRTGIVFDVTPRAVGVEVRKVVGSREILKRLHVRIEHVRKSRCQEEFLRRVKENDAARHQAKLEGRTIVTKRLPEGPKEGAFVKAEEVEMLEPLRFEESY